MSYFQFSVSVPWMSKYCSALLSQPNGSVPSNPGNSTLLINCFTSSCTSNRSPFDESLPSDVFSHKHSSPCGDSFTPTFPLIICSTNPLSPASSCKFLLMSVTSDLMSIIDFSSASLLVSDATTILSRASNFASERVDAIIAGVWDPAGSATPNSGSSSERSHHQHSKYQTPASALYESAEHMEHAHPSSQITSGKNGESSIPTASDPIAMMEFYMKKAAQEEKLRPPKPSKDEMPPPAALQASTKIGHHMGDYIPPEEHEKFLATCNDAAAQKAAKEYADKTKIQADNVGHKLLSKMGWREGEGLGSSKSGIAAPIMAGDVNKDNLGIGAHAPGEVTSDDDIYEQYKKRMMLGYRHRPNPLNNPRKSYY